MKWRRETVRETGGRWLMYQEHVWREKEKEVREGGEERKERRERDNHKDRSIHLQHLQLTEVAGGCRPSL